MTAPRSVLVAETLPKFLLPRLSWRASSATGAISHDLRARSGTAAGAAIATRRHSTWPCTGRRATWSPILSRAAFHTTPTLRRDHHFDTLKFVQRLQDEGFTEEQAAAMMKVLNDVIEESIDEQ
ncbi:Protein of unknown function (DUF1640) [Geosmithia morbida]|uniref:Uncharacterized protein n=1 Tax=Geosmithia morbida TaxID=1094350 RepID=A0A9P5D3X7_9HYPO|nr:Protein of unknown function (DUF1640) [Geosmithia morbida]KAF4122956.1 Protein of unknown function (DUF1640) [Geosmithia morbida]